jgi:hypothetical protein
MPNLLWDVWHFGIYHKLKKHWMKCYDLLESLKILIFQNCHKDIRDPASNIPTNNFF